MIKEVKFDYNRYFGLGLLMGMSTSMLAITSGVYTVILQQSGLASSPTDQLDLPKKTIRHWFFAAWSCHIFFALFNLIIILVSSHRLTEAVRFTNYYIL
jgi:hypothetical protein